jgi:hypothetical protein
MLGSALTIGTVTDQSVTFVTPPGELDATVPVDVETRGGTATTEFRYE